MKCRKCGGLGYRTHPRQSDDRCSDCGTPVQNKLPYIRQIQRQTHSWRMEKWPNVTPLAQVLGTAIEVMELGDLILKSKFYDEEWADDQRLKEEAGDAFIYLLGVISLLGFDVIECIEAALDKNNDRDWETHQKAPSDD